MESTLQGEFVDAAECYAQFGRAVFDGDEFSERRITQCPTVFALPSIPSQPLWSQEVGLGCVIAEDIVRAISREYHQHHHLLQKERIVKDVLSGAWEAAYLMEEGRWHYGVSSKVVSECFPITASVLSSLSVFETGLGYVYFSRLSAGSVIRPHCGPTNCKLRLQIVLYGPEAGDSQEEDESVLGKLTVGGEEVWYRSGDCVVLDDSYVHGVNAGMGGERVVLLVDVWHPELLKDANREVYEGLKGVFPILCEGEEVSESMATAAASVCENIGITAVVAGSELDIWGGGIVNGMVSEADVMAVMGHLEEGGTPVAMALADVEVDQTSVSATTEAGREADKKAMMAAEVLNDALDRQEALAAARDVAVAESMSSFTNVNLTDARAVVFASDVFIDVNHLRYVDFEKRQATRGDMQTYDYLLKMLLIGDCGVGKSSYLLRLADDTFTDSFISTIGVDFKIVHRVFMDPICPRSVTEAPLAVKLQLWDTAGPERFRTISSSYYRGAHGIFVVFDLSDRETFERCHHWMSEIAKYGSPELAVILVGAKCDRPWNGPLSKDGETLYGARHNLYRQVSHAEALAFAEQYQIPYVECSAKTGKSVDDVTATLLHHVFRKRENLQKGIPLNQAQRPPPRVENRNNNRCTLS